jgi:hypothetical protein
MIFKIKSLVSLFLLILILPNSTFAQSIPTITIVNEIRGPELGLNEVDIQKSLEGQWNATKDSSVSATWLWQYSALEDQKLTDFAKQNMTSDQEQGIFLEIDKNFATKSGIEYKGKVAWYQSDGLLLVSYDQYERHKLIDNVFEKFKQTFGAYPKSVGAWWVGAESIEYMQKKYGITAVLQCADQFNTDAYSIWGTPWSIPYRPSKINSAIPAQDIDSSSNVVVSQWAPRDPLKGYGPSVKDSTYSLQDYEMKGYDTRYFEYLKNIFLQKEYDQIVFGLEAGLPPESYQGQYKKQIQKTVEWQRDQKIKIQTMEQYADSFLKQNLTLPPTSYFLSKDYENNNQSFWYHSQSYRIFIQKVDNDIFVSDIRDYSKNQKEEFYDSPNIQTLLRINTDSIVDTIRFPEQKINLLTSQDTLSITEDNNIVILKSGDKEIAQFSKDQIVFPTVQKNYQFSSSILEKLKSELLYRQVLLTLDTSEFSHNISLQLSKATSSKKQILSSLLKLYLLIGLLLVPLILFHQKNYKSSLLFSSIYISTIAFIIFNPLNSEPRRIIPTTFELDALQFLKNQTNSKVVFLSPEENLNFRAVHPFLYSKPQLASSITKNNWSIIKRQINSELAIHSEQNQLIIVPRYLGQELYSYEKEKYKLHKVFDNAQIEIYSLN